MNGFSKYTIFASHYKRINLYKYDLHENTFALDVLYSPADASPTDEENLLI